MNTKQDIMNYYDSITQHEWERMDRHPAEHVITLRFMERYIRPGDRILDVSGGPGRYSIHFAKMGCDVTLVDLSPNNVNFAIDKANESNVSIRAFAGDACMVDQVVDGEYDHVFLMGALYHLQKQSEWTQAVHACLKRLKVGGIFYASFISHAAGILYYLSSALEGVLNDSPTAIQQQMDNIQQGQDYIANSFTHTRFVSPRAILPFFYNFPLKKLHLFGQESILTQAESALQDHPREVLDHWLDIAEKLAEHEDYLTHAAHLMYIGQKI